MLTGEFRTFCPFPILLDQSLVFTFIALLDRLSGESRVDCRDFLIEEIELPALFGGFFPDNRYIIYRLGIVRIHRIDLSFPSVSFILPRHEGTLGNAFHSRGRLSRKSRSKLWNFAREFQDLMYILVTISFSV